MEEEGKVLSQRLRQRLEELGFKFESFSSGDVIWGFDGITRYYPEENYLKNSNDGKPAVSLKIKKTHNGITLIINSVPFQEKYHLDKAPLTEEEVFDVVEKYLKLL